MNFQQFLNEQEKKKLLTKKANNNNNKKKPKTKHNSNILFIFVMETYIPAVINRITLW